MEKTARSALDAITYTQQHSLYVPKLEELVGPIEEHLKTQFADVKVSVEKCPDLTEWGLAKEGLCSSSPANSKLVEVGGIPNICSSKGRYIVHSLSQVANSLGQPNAYIIGAGALPLKG